MRLHAKRSELWTEHQRIHDELEATFAEARRLHYVLPMLSNHPPPESPAKPKRAKFQCAMAG